MSSTRPQSRSFDERLDPLWVERDLWRRAAEPVAAHGLAERRLDGTAYARARGVAQQAARLARPTRLSRIDRTRLLSAAWLHSLGGEPVPQRSAARALRRAGHEDLARTVAYSGGALVEASRLGMAPLDREFRPPVGDLASIGRLLDIAIVTTGTRGERCSPAAALRALVDERGPGDARVAATVALLGAMAEDPMARALVEAVVPSVVA